MESVNFSKFVGSVGSANLISIPNCLNVFANWFHVPPYKSVDETILSPALHKFCIAIAEADCPEDTANAANPPSNCANLSSRTAVVGFIIRV